ncbi:hypothetical protein [Pseudomonas sp. MWU13-2105]|uniref:hypothetical protein n=1 Tax=Pseudomonas sp. MWU13-2105 TaxID=2935074 RepID=UPI00200F4C87|nr:hypothetical protein [Pseudomonas sp. MWU13-2105]
MTIVLADCQRMRVVAGQLDPVRGGLKGNPGHDFVLGFSRNQRQERRLVGIVGDNHNMGLRIGGYLVNSEFSAGGISDSRARSECGLARCIAHAFISRVFWFSLRDVYRHFHDSGLTQSDIDLTKLLLEIFLYKIAPIFYKNSRMKQLAKKQIKIITYGVRPHHHIKIFEFRETSPLIGFQKSPIPLGVFLFIRHLGNSSGFTARTCGPPG